ncbi:MAG: hypothetical protein N2Z62_12145 [Rhodobacteraceae bacterium]|nr:hypothetical protein [Paracoccaceae bacterium]
MSQAPVLARLHPSPARRGLAVAVLAALGGLLLWVALARPPETLHGRLLLPALGLLALWLAERLRRATRAHLELTREVLRDSRGRVLAALGEVRAVHSGVFALKPSSGFTLELAAPGPAAWEPGLWWRLGRRLGVGGVTAGREARYMAEVVRALLAERASQPPDAGQG